MFWWKKKANPLPEASTGTPMAPVKPPIRGPVYPWQTPEMMYDKDISEPVWSIVDSLKIHPEEWEAVGKQTCHYSIGRNIYDMHIRHIKHGVEIQYILHTILVKFNITRDEQVMLKSAMIDWLKWHQKLSSDKERQRITQLFKRN